MQYHTQQTISNVAWAPHALRSFLCSNMVCVSMRDVKGNLQTMYELLPILGLDYSHFAGSVRFMCCPKTFENLLVWCALMLAPDQQHGTLCGKKITLIQLHAVWKGGLYCGNFSRRFLRFFCFFLLLFKINVPNYVLNLFVN